MTSYRSLPPRRRRTSARYSSATSVRRSRSLSPTAQTRTDPPSHRLKKVRKKNPVRHRRAMGSVVQKVIGVSTLGVGMGLIISLSIFTPPLPQTVGLGSREQSLPGQTAQMSFGQPSDLDTQVRFPLRRELSTLQSRVGELAGQYGKGSVGVFVLDFDTGDYVNWNGTESFMAASTIKLPLLLAFFQAVDRGEIELTEALVMDSNLIAGEAGNMQYQLPGTEFSALETVTQMITISDNTATNMIVERLGGSAQVNKQLKQQELHATQLSNLLPDIEGTNLTSPVDLANVLIDIEQGEDLSNRSRDRVLRILNSVVNDKLLASGLGKDAVIAHKTGTIGKLIADAGLVDVPNGKRYLTVVIVERPHNDPGARSLIQQISSEVYDHFNTVDS